MVRTTKKGTEQSTLVPSDIAGSRIMETLLRRSVEVTCCSSLGLPHKKIEVQSWWQCSKTQRAHIYKY